MSISKLRVLFEEEWTKGGILFTKERGITCDNNLLSCVHSLLVDLPKMGVVHLKSTQHALAYFSHTLSMPACVHTLLTYSLYACHYIEACTIYAFHSIYVHITIILWYSTSCVQVCNLKNFMVENSLLTPQVCTNLLQQTISCSTSS